MASYEAVEQSNDDGMPVRLYEFQLGNAIWRYCDVAHDVTVGGVVYLPLAISDEGFTQNGELNGDEFQITMPANQQPALLYDTTPPFESVTVKVRRWHYGSPSAAVIASGFIYSTNRSSSATMVLTCRVLLASLDQLGLRLSWSKQCSYGLYDRQCKVNRDNFRLTAAVTAKTGASVTMTGAGANGNNYYAGGYIEFSRGVGGVLDRLGISSQSGNQLQLLGTTEHISVGQTINAYPGCNYTPSTCQTRFNNLLNYGGFPQMPDKSLFDGDPIL